MPTNIEWKARARDPQRQRMLAEQLTGHPPEILDQVDTFFPVPNGRLKMRQLSAYYAELIYYLRADQVEARESDYLIVPSDEPAGLRELLAQALGIRGEVRKRRWLYLLGSARVHLDEVEGLGAFLEVEVVLQPGQAPAEGEQLAETLRRQLEVHEEDLIACAYIDLLEHRSGKN